MSRARHRARERATQALYQWQLTDQSPREIENQFVSQEDMSNVDLAYFHELLHGVAGGVQALDQEISPFLDRAIEQVDPVERAILRLGAYELARRLDVPYRVVINEAVELAKTFGAEQGHKYVNSILDKAAQTLRAAEVKSRY